MTWVRKMNDKGNDQIYYKYVSSIERMDHLLMNYDNKQEIQIDFSKGFVPRSKDLNWYGDYLRAES